MKNKKILLLLTLPLFLVGCQTTPTSSVGGSNPSSPSSDSVSSSTSATSSNSTGTSVNDSIIVPEGYTTIAEAKALIPNKGDEYTQEVTIRARIVEITNATNGHMNIEDDTGEMEVYYSFSEDGQDRFGELEEKPEVGDIVDFVGTLENYNGRFEIKDAKMLGYGEKPHEVSEYTKMSIAEARKASDESLVRIEGTVISIQTNSSGAPVGLFVSDGVDTMYVYDRNVAGQVELNEIVDICGKKEHYVSDSEKSYAETYGYIGSNQMSVCQLVSHTASSEEFDYSNFPESTIKDMIETDFSEDITGQVFKTNAYIVKSEGPDYVNYYINDLSGNWDTYVYSQASGYDFDWLDSYCSTDENPEVYTVYVTAINAKSGASGCNWRFYPMKVVDDDFAFDLETASQFVLDSFVTYQFEDVYYADPAKEVMTSYSQTSYGIENVEISYSSDNESAFYFEEAEGKTIFHTGVTGEANITINVTLDGHASATKTLTLNMYEADDIPSINVKQAIDTAAETEVTVRGVVGPSLVVQPGFYLIDDSGVIAIRLFNETDISKFNIGDEVIIKGTRDLWGNSEYGAAQDTQICVSNATLLANLYGNHEYSTKSFIVDPNYETYTCDYLYNLDYEDRTNTAKVFVIKATISTYKNNYSEQWQIEDDTGYFNLYSSSFSQYNWLEPYKGKECYIEVAPCNWNNKDFLRGCILSVTDVDGNIGKTLNTLNWNN